MKRFHGMLGLLCLMTVFMGGEASAWTQYVTARGHGVNCTSNVTLYPNGTLASCLTAGTQIAWTAINEGQNCAGSTMIYFDSAGNLSQCVLAFTDTVQSGPNLLNCAASNWAVFHSTGNLYTCMLSTSQLIRNTANSLTNCRAGFPVYLNSSGYLTSCTPV